MCIAKCFYIYFYLCVCVCVCVCVCARAHVFVFKEKDRKDGERVERKRLYVRKKAVCYLWREFSPGVSETSASKCVPM